MSTSTSSDSPEREVEEESEAMLKGDGEEEEGSDEEGKGKGVKPPGWDNKYLQRFAMVLLRRPLLFKPPSGSRTESYKARRAALQAVAKAMGFPQHKHKTIRRRVATFKKIFLNRMMKCACEAARRGLGDPLQLAPRWARTVEPLLRDSPELLRVYARGAAGGRAPPAPGPARAEAVRRAMDALSARARRLRALDAARVCRALPALPGADPAQLAHIWERMLDVTRQKLQLLIECGDSSATQAEGERLSAAEWRVADAALLLGGEAWRVARPEHCRRLEPLQALVASFHLAQLFRLERGGAGAAPAAWRAALAAYRARGRVGSALLLQRRWHELKLQARERILREAGPRARRASQDLRPAPIHVAVVRRFPHVVTEPLPSWRELVEAGGVVEEITDEGEAIPDAEHFMALDSPNEHESVPCEDDDLILIEQEIETIDLLIDDEDLQHDSRDHSDDQSHEHSDDQSRDQLHERGDPHLETFREALQNRRRKMAKALEAELDRQLRDLDRPRPAPAPAPLAPAPAPLPPLSGAEPQIVFDSDEEIGNNVTSNTLPVKLEQIEETESEGEFGLEREREREGEVKGEVMDDDEPTIDEKLLMTTSVTLVKVDSVSGWKRDASQCTVDIRRLDLQPLAPKRRRSDAVQPDTKVMSQAYADYNSDTVYVKSESGSDAGETETGDAADTGERETERATRKRVQLPDIAEVRRINQRMLTAQVAPLSAPLSTPLPLQHRRDSESEEGALCIDESATEEGRSEDGSERETARGSLSAAELRAVLRRLRRQRAGGAGAGPGARRPDAYHCCAARRHRALNDARRRNAARANRNPPHEVELHRSRCPGLSKGGECACCCKHLLSGADTERALLAASLELHSRIRRVLGPADPPPLESEENSKDAIKSDAEGKKTDTEANKTTDKTKDSRKKKSKKKRKKTSPSASETNETSVDPLQEWIRQKNIASRFFDLNLKQPPTPVRIAPAPMRPKAPTQATAPMRPIAPPQVPAPMRPKAPTQATAPILPIAPLQVPAPMRPKVPTQATAPMKHIALPQATAPERLSSFMRVKPPYNVSCKPITAMIQQKEKSQTPQSHTPPTSTQSPTKTLSNPNNDMSLLKKHTFQFAPSMTSTSPNTPGGGGLPTNAIPVALIPVQDGSGFKLVPVQFTPAPVSTPSAVIDLCDDDDEASPPNQPPSTPPTPLSCTNRDVLVRLPSDISVSRKKESPPAGGAGTGGGGGVLLNEQIAKTPPATNTLEVSPIEQGKSNIKVFQISKNGRLRLSKIVPENPPSPPVHPLLSAPSPPGAPALDTKGISKIVIVPRGAVGPGASPTLRLTRSAPAPPAPRATPPRLLNDELLSSTATPTTAAAPTSTALLAAATAALKIAEIKTKDGRRVLVVRRSGSGATMTSPPTNTSTTKLVTTSNNKLVTTPSNTKPVTTPSNTKLGPKPTSTKPAFTTLTKQTSQQDSTAITKMKQGSKQGDTLIAKSVFVTKKGNTVISNHGSSTITKVGDTVITKQGATVADKQADTNVFQQGNTTITRQGNTAVSKPGNITVIKQGNTTITKQGNTTITIQGNTNVAKQGNMTVTKQGNTTITKQVSSVVNKQENTVVNTVSKLVPINEEGNTITTKKTNTVMIQQGTSFITQQRNITMTQQGPIVMAQPGTLITQQGTTFMSQQGTAFVTQQGSTVMTQQVPAVMTQQGATFMAQQGTTFMTQQGDTVMTQQGTAFMTQQGNTVMTQQGTTFMTQQGNTVVTQQGTAFMTQQRNTVMTQQGTAFMTQQVPTVMAQQGPTFMTHEGTTVMIQPENPMLPEQAAPVISYIPQALNTPDFQPILHQALVNEQTNGVLVTAGTPLPTDGGTNRASRPIRYKGFSDKTITVEEWVKTKPKLVVQCLDLAVPYYTVSLHRKRYYVVCDSCPLPRPLAAESVWSAHAHAPAGGGGGCVRLRDAHTRTHTLARHQRLYRRLSDAPRVYARVVYVVRSISELKQLAVAGAVLRVVCAADGSSGRLQPAGAQPGDAQTFTCQLFGVAEVIMNDLKLPMTSASPFIRTITSNTAPTVAPTTSDKGPTDLDKAPMPKYEPRGSRHRPHPNTFGNFVRIAPKPAVTPSTPIYTNTSEKDACEKETQNTVDTHEDEDSDNLICTEIHFTVDEVEVEVDSEVQSKKQVEGKRQIEVEEESASEEEIVLPLSVKRQIEVEKESEEEIVLPLSVKRQIEVEEESASEEEIVLPLSVKRQIEVEEESASEEEIVLPLSVKRQIEVEEESASEEEIVLPLSVKRQIEVEEESASEEEIVLPRPSRRAAQNARAKLNDIMKKEEEREGDGEGGRGEGRERQLDYAEALGLDCDDDDDYDAGRDYNDYTHDKYDDIIP